MFRDPGAVTRSRGIWVFLVPYLYNILSIIAPSIHASDFEYCNKRKDYVVTVTGVEVSPDPITRDQETSFVVSAFTDKPLSGGKVVIRVAYFGISVFSQTGDLCDNISCPIPAGGFTISYSQFLPVIAPPGSYTRTLKVQDGYTKELTCIKFDFKIGFFKLTDGPIDT
ncbi:uncharacterized protein LOC143622859 [Bidens hawaiensis]|uniref:uncharacterized protein LOC143622859 n=1 Tax=Bidens hawaiensis TaxID=980011 RepID=UPI004049EA65